VTPRGTADSRALARLGAGPVAGNPSGSLAAKQPEGLPPEGAKAEREGS